MYEISFDIVAKNGNIVAKNGNYDEATFDFVERKNQRIVQLVAFDNVASTLFPGTNHDYQSVDKSVSVARRQAENVRRDAGQGNINILQYLQSYRRASTSTKHYLNPLIQFYLNNVKNLHQLTSQSTTSFHTTGP